MDKIQDNYKHQLAAVYSWMSIDFRFSIFLSIGDRLSTSVYAYQKLRLDCASRPIALN
jgi:hypothetical protein